MEGVLVGAGGAGTPSVRRTSTLEQSINPTNAHIGPGDELGTRYPP